MKDDGKLQHPSDGKQWKRFNAKFSEFGDEAKNVRFALSTNGMNHSVTLASLIALGRSSSLSTTNLLGCVRSTGTFC